MKRCLPVTVLVLMSTVAIYHTTEAWRQTYFEPIYNYALIGHVIDTLKDSAFDKCFNECVKKFNCFSLNIFGYDHDKKQCYLNNSSRQADPDNFIFTEGNSYWEIRVSGMNMAISLHYLGTSTR